MLFPTHLLAGYLLGRRWTGLPAWAVLGAALPDLIDKPLGWAGATPLFQSVGHSALSLLALSGVAALLARRAGRPGTRVAAVALGWGSHLALDVLGIALDGHPENWVLLLWPVLRKPDPSGLDPISFYLASVPSPSFYAEVGIWLLGAYVLLWRRSGRRSAT